MSFHNYTCSPNLIRGDGYEWRGVRTRDHMYVTWRDGRRMLYDLRTDPGQLDNLAGRSDVEPQLAQRLSTLLAEWNDPMPPYSTYASWLDPERRIVKNVWGDLPHPETPPDWSLLC